MTVPKKEKLEWSDPNYYETQGRNDMHDMWTKYIDEAPIEDILKGGFKRIPPEYRQEETSKALRKLLKGE